MTAVLASARLDDLLEIAYAKNATDVHFSPGALPALRILGAIEMQTGSAPTEDEVAAIAAELLTHDERARLDRSGDVTIGRTHGNARIRVHVFRSLAGLAISIRILSSVAPALTTLGLPKSIESLTRRSHGFVILTGPTGSGKSTAMAAMVDAINREQARRIITIEDPIEYIHESRTSCVSQREVNRDVATFSDAVTGALRADPDVLLIGEMRTPETIRAALSAAETGHLVFTSLHTGDSTQTMDRITSSFDGAAREQVRVSLAQTLLGVVCLRLLPRKDGRGRVAAAEILFANDAVRNVIRDGKTHQLRNIIATSRASGMQTLESHLNEMVRAGEVSLAAAQAAGAFALEARDAGFCG